MRRGQVLAGLVGLGLVAVAVWVWRPQPVQVDLAEALVAPLAVTVAAEGVTRVRDPWTVTAPLTGSVERAPVAVGDPVVAGETVVAVLRPAEPAFLDARARAEAQATVTEAEAAVRLAEVNLTRAEAEQAHAEAQLTRNRALADRGIVAQSLLEDSTQAADSAARATEAARFELDLHRATLVRAQAQLMAPASTEHPGDCCLQLTAPLSGTVLELPDTNARLVQAGEALLTLGDLGDLGIETDLLSSDAVQVVPGARAMIEGWGGEGVLEAVVRRVEPSGFTRVSALGIEEQRVKVKLDLVTPPEARPGLGDRFRVMVRIVIWETNAALQVPQGALFRQAGAWAVFRVEGDVARLVRVEPGRGDGLTVQILDGLAPGDRVVAYPGAALSDGARVAVRAD